jgi:hypothetical protein
VGEPARDHRLGVGVDRRCRLDQHQDLWVRAKRPGQDQPLPLATGQPARTLVDPALPATRESLEDILRRSRVQRQLGLLQRQPSARIDNR